MGKVIVVTGVGGSGTSAVAGCLHRMGVSMGLHFAPRHPAGFELYEDTCLYGAFGLPLARMRDALRQYVATHQRPGAWGFKNTLAWKSFGFLPALLDTLGYGFRVVVSHRTFAASVRARMGGRCPPGYHCERDEAERWAITAMVNMLTAVGSLHCPVLHVSYEDLVRDPRTEVARLAEFAGTGLTDEAVTFVRQT